MKTLLLLRHAKSSWKDPGLDDHERPLNKRGKQDAPRMGRLLKDEGLVPDLIISSTARRARKTSEAVAEASGYATKVEMSEDLYLAGPESQLAVLRDLPDTLRSVMLVGHNPGLEDLVQRLTGATESMPTAALARIDLPIERWRQLNLATRGELVNLWRPREL